MITWLEGLPRIGKSTFLAALTLPPEVACFQTDAWLETLPISDIPPRCTPLPFLESRQGLEGYLAHKAQLGRKVACRVRTSLAKVDHAVVETTPFILAGLLPCLEDFLQGRVWRIIQVGVSPGSHFHRVQQAHGCHADRACQLVSLYARAAALLPWGPAQHHLDHPQERLRLALTLCTLEGDAP